MSCPFGTSYFVKPGDTLVMISQQVLGDGDRWSEIRNPDGTSPPPEELQPGQELCVPNELTAMVYEDANFLGKSAPLGVGQYDRGQLGIATLSSLRVPPLTLVRFYKEGYYKDFWPGDVSDVGDDLSHNTSVIIVSKLRSH